METSCAPPAPRRSSPSTATPTSSAAPGWPPSPQDGVVDADHRVFGVAQLFIVDGSTLPTQGAANPALTIMALAARAADRMPTAPDRRERPTSTACAMTGHRPADRAASTSPSTGSHPGTRSRRHPAAGTPPPPSPCTLTAGGAHRAGLDLQRRGRGRRDHRRTWPRGARPRRLRRRRLLVGDAPRLPQPGHPRPGHAGHQRRRHRPVGPQGPAARRPARRRCSGRAAAPRSRSTAPAGSPPSTDTSSPSRSTSGPTSAAPR